jgi:hypothetical protein
LLQLFGVPWIVSPTEAEAQCAFLGKFPELHCFVSPLILNNKISF